VQHAITGKIEIFNASDWKIGIVVSSFNQDITNSLYQSALKRAVDYKIKEENITTINVAGAAEIPLALQKLAKTNEYDALLAIGCVIQGDTPHFDYVCKIATEGILAVQLTYDIAIGYGLLTLSTLGQAEERKNLGGDHLDAAIQLAQAFK
jgi:6,7-dimethyl-8-ribityllumazine synthase